MYDATSPLDSSGRVVPSAFAAISRVSGVCMFCIFLAALLATRSPCSNSFLHARKKLKIGVTNHKSETLGELRKFVLQWPCSK